MDIHEKINMKMLLFLYLETNQALQLIQLNRIALAPYYGQRMKRQAQEVDEANRFKATFGSYRVEYENRKR